MPGMPDNLYKFKGATREKVRRAMLRVLERVEARDDKKGINVSRLRDEKCGDQNAATELLRAWRAGLVSVGDSWDDVRAQPVADAAQSRGPAGSRESLAARIRSATTDGEREALLHELAALVASGEVAPDEAGQIKGALTEARQAADAKRSNEPPPEDPTRLLFARPSTLMAARALDLMVDDARRDRVYALIAAELEADRAASPNVDRGGAA